MVHPDFNLYLATGSKQYLEFLLICGVKNILISFAYKEPWDLKPLIKRHDINLLCDSGAFTSWNLANKKKREGDPNWQKFLVNIDEYYEFIKEHEDIIYRAVNLDVIPGEQGSKPSQKEINDAAEQGWENYQYLKKKGIDTIHVFHYGEDNKFLDRMLDECDYIGISPSNDLADVTKLKWLDHTFRYLQNYDYSKNPRIERGKIIKTHGFGVTSKTLVERYPWFCMTDDHEVLTKTGWKKRTEIKIGEEILTFDKGVSQWQPILNIPVFSVKDIDLYELDYRTFSARVTPNHRWQIKHENGSWQWQTTESLKATHKIPRIGNYINFPKEKKYTDEFVELFAWFWTEGTINKRKKWGYKKDSIVLYQSESVNKDKVDMIRTALKNSNEKFCEITSKRINGTIEKSFELYGWIRDLLLELSPEKNIPLDFLLSLTKEQLELFIKISILADGYKTDLKTEKSFGISQKNKQRLEEFQFACILAGYATSLKHYKNESTLLSSPVKEIYMNKDMRKKIISYSGIIWCVTVQSGAFFTRCNGKIYVTGNSCDSSSYSLTAAMGNVLSPFGRLYISDQNLGKQDHILNKPQETQKFIDDYFKKKIGYGIKSMTENSTEYIHRCEKCNNEIPIIQKQMSYKARNFANIIYFMDMQDKRRKDGPTMDYMRQQILF